jgi:hypothetical protein
VRDKSIAFLQKTKTELAAAKSITVKEKERRTDPVINLAKSLIDYDAIHSLLRTI